MHNNKMQKKIQEKIKPSVGQTHATQYCVQLINCK